MKIHSQIYIYPTDTVWGIGGGIYDFDLYLRVAEIKGTALNKPVSILYSNVEDILNDFPILNKLDKSLLNEILSLESTLCVDTQWMRKNVIPTWIYQDGSFVAVRCLPYVWIKEICLETKSPIITTSLNLTGQHPINDYVEAKNFYHGYAPDAKFLDWPQFQTLQLSGTASTLFHLDIDDIIDKNLNLKILRTGRLAIKISEILSDYCHLS